MRHILRCTAVANHQGACSASPTIMVIMEPRAHQCLEPFHCPPTAASQTQHAAACTRSSTPATVARRPGASLRDQARPTAPAVAAGCRAHGRSQAIAFHLALALLCYPPLFPRQTMEMGRVEQPGNTRSSHHITRQLRTPQVLDNRQQFTLNP